MRRQRGDDRVYNIGKKKACRGVPVIQSRARALRVIEWPGARLAHKYIFTSGERVDHWKAYSPGRLGGISLMSDTEITLSPHIYTVNTLVYPSLSSSLTNRGREHKRVERLRERLDNGRIMAKLWELESPRGIPGEKFSAAFAPFFRALRWPDGAYSDEILRGFAWNCAPGKWNFRGAPRMLGQQSSSILVLHNTAGHFSSSSILLLFFCHTTAWKIVNETLRRYFGEPYCTAAFPNCPLHIYVIRQCHATRILRKGHPKTHSLFKIRKSRWKKIIVF